MTIDKLGQGPTLALPWSRMKTQSSVPSSATPSTLEHPAWGHVSPSARATDTVELGASRDLQMQ